MEQTIDRRTPRADVGCREGLTPCSLTDSGLFEGLMPVREQLLRTLSLLLLLLLSLLIRCHHGLECPLCRPRKYMKMVLLRSDYAMRPGTGVITWIGAGEGTGDSTGEGIGDSTGEGMHKSTRHHVAEGCELCNCPFALRWPQALE